MLLQSTTLLNHGSYRPIALQKNYSRQQQQTRFMALISRTHGCNSIVISTVSLSQCWL